MRFITRNSIYSTFTITCKSTIPNDTREIYRNTFISTIININFNYNFITIMRELQISTKKGDNVIINLPTKLAEITPAYLKEVSDHIGIASDYSLIAIIYRDKLANIINSQRNKKDTSVSVICKFVKCGDTDNKFIKNITCGDTCVISSGDLSIAHHVGCDYNDLSLSKILAIASQSDDIYRKALNYGFENNYFVEFKLIPNNAIHGVIGIPKDVSTHFINIEHKK